MFFTTRISPAVRDCVSVMKVATFDAIATDEMTIFFWGVGVAFHEGWTVPVVPAVVTCQRLLFESRKIDADE